MGASVAERKSVSDYNLLGGDVEDVTAMTSCRAKAAVGITVLMSLSIILALAAPPVSNVPRAANTGPTALHLLSSALGELPSCSPQLQWVEARANCWIEAAEGIIAKLKALGVRRGQIISIDAHKDGPDGSVEQAIFSAYYSTSYQSLGPLNINYTEQNEVYAWPEFYDVAAQRATSDVFSITGSSNFPLLAVMYRFAYWPPAENSVPVDLRWLEARGDNWTQAADSIIEKLANAGVQRGQIVSIDAHNNGPDDQAIFSAHYNPSALGFGNASIKYSLQNTDAYGWAQFYTNATRSATADLIGITSSSNTRSSAVTFVFEYQ
mmetsp:Transcript_20882/g.46011  ORF Transcript_20882/g.46011 Transcript_20882/m.46011 type:complete len:322 (-) Transcript_20882:143-1108(-)